MIAYLEGTVKATRESAVIVLCAGVGYEVFVARPTLDKCKPGDTIELFTRMVVREDSMTLYGFHHVDLQQMFDILTGVSGVGPKLALAMLSQLPINVLAGAILDGDSKLLSSVSGVGKRTAERLVLELQGKIPEQLRAGSTGKKAAVQRNPNERDAIDALIALGYREVHVRTVVSELTSENPEATTDLLIRKGLSKLK
ncbi:Holliday junction branch migration protein RuvA [Deinococcus cellulosilyticus]|uniref:Holliday junction branch migration complex subunit RuvA n=1 Tax=Deinococcus cellulosilyticus (strain DSM 18568 / NBRC 106333 / KACC 11606 / 5516J-15) TaxID=1223518 RepID=A0A511MYI3_DEIC1|nr:Holliday junction branch migration protein RuvA [Deinococcus cellulosilyticus]GEM45197.1 Holliday junction ATP-dependent DNA helicase RuvA [Deinococcus cellulosilyticus NBRC 106333 = KACC 11606]